MTVSSGLTTGRYSWMKKPNDVKKSLVHCSLFNPAVYLLKFLCCGTLLSALAPAESAFAKCKIGMLNLHREWVNAFATRLAGLVANLFSLCCWEPGGPLFSFSARQTSAR